MFEDWWIHPSFFPSDVFSNLTALDFDRKEHTEIMEILKSIP